MKKFNEKIKYNIGMTYVELIVVLAIFGVMSSVVLLNYKDFISQIEIKSLANDIVLKIVEAQRNASSGKLNYDRQLQFQDQNGFLVDNWKPSYGIFLKKNIDPKSFISFIDLDDSAVNNTDAYNTNDMECQDLECLEKISINKSSSISDITVYCNNNPQSVNDFSVSFVRSNPRIFMQSKDVPYDCSISQAVIKLTSSASVTASIIIYPSGIIQVK